MARVTIGTLTVRISPAATMKCLVGLNAWHTYSEFREREDVAGFCARLCQYVMARPDDASLPELAALVSEQIARLQRGRDLREPAIDALGQKVRALLRDQQRRAHATRYAEQAAAWFERFAAQPYLDLALCALGHLERVGARLPGPRPFCDAYVALRPPELNSTGQYVPWLSAVAVQMDAIIGGRFAEIEFIETLLHEQVHAVIHARMRDQGEHYARLPWFNELTAILLSQYAIARAYADLRYEPAFRAVPAALRAARAQQEWGDLAAAVLRATGDPLVTWRAWQAIFARGAYIRRNYAHRDILPPIVGRAGWRAAFPFAYGARAVDCRDDLVP